MPEISMKPGAFTRVDAPVNIIQGTKSEQLEWCPKSSPALLPFVGSSFAEVSKALRETFGDFPLQLKAKEHEGILRGMMNAAGEGGGAYEILLNAVTYFEELEVRLK